MFEKLEFAFIMFSTVAFVACFGVLIYSILPLAH
jgi:hypothetical protein